MAVHSQSFEIPQEAQFRFILTLGGHIFFQTLCAAVDLDIFTLLQRKKSLTVTEIAAEVGIERKPARILLLGCTALGLVTKSGESYSNSTIADLFLSADSAAQMIPIIRWQQHINYPAMPFFGESLRANSNVGLKVFEGKEATLYERLAHQPRLERIFQEAMAAISVQANSHLAEQADLSEISTLVDVGGGNGTNLLALARRHQHLRGYVFDSPTVCTYAEKNFAANGMSERLAAHPGQCFKDPFPKDIDAILFAHFFTIWSEEKNRFLLKKAYEALPKNGQVLIFNMMQSDDENGPITAALGSPYFLTLATGEGMLYTWKEYETWMKEIGFKEIRRQILPTDHGLIIGRKTS